MNLLNTDSTNHLNMSRLLYVFTMVAVYVVLRLCVLYALLQVNKLILNPGGLFGILSVYVTSYRARWVFSAVWNTSMVALNGVWMFDYAFCVTRWITNIAILWLYDPHLLDFMQYDIPWRRAQVVGAALFDPAVVRREHDRGREIRRTVLTIEVEDAVTVVDQEIISVMSSAPTWENESTVERYPPGDDFDTVRSRVDAANLRRRILQHDTTSTNGGSVSGALQRDHTVNNDFMSLEQDLGGFEQFHFDPQGGWAREDHEEEWIEEDIPDVVLPYDFGADLEIQGGYVLDVEKQYQVWKMFRQLPFSLEFQGDCPQLSEKNMRRKQWRDKAANAKRAFDAQVDRLVKNRAQAEKQCKSKEDQVVRRKAIDALAYLEKRHPGATKKPKKAKVPPQKLPPGAKLQIQAGRSFSTVRLDSFMSNLSEPVETIKSKLDVEELLALVMSLYQCTTCTHAMTIMTLYISTKMDKGIVKSLYSVMHDVFTEYYDCPDVWEPQGGVDLKTTWSIMRTSKVFKYLARIVMLVVCAAGCSSLTIPFTVAGFSKAFAAYEKSTDCTVDLVDKVFECLQFFYEKCLQYFKCGSLSEVFYDDDKATRYEKLYSATIALAPYVDSCLVERLETPHHQIHLNLTTLLDETAVYMKAAKSDGDRRIFGAKMTALLKMKHSLELAYQHMPSRPKPLAIYLHGASGVGKTTVLNMLTHSLQQAIPEMAKGKEYIVHMNAADKYMSEPKPHHQVLVIDDIANSMPMYTEGNPCQLVIDVINSEPKAMLKADVAGKGNCYMNFVAVYGSGNDVDMQAGVYSVCPSSILRRWDLHVHVTVKPEYRIEGGQSIDSMKTESLTGSNPWLFTLCRRFLSDTQPAGPMTVPHVDQNGKPMVDIEIDEFLRFQTWYAKRFFQQQWKLLKAQNDLFNLAGCEHGSLVGVCKDCLVPQGGEEWESVYKQCQSYSRSMSVADICLWLAFLSLPVTILCRVVPIGIFVVWCCISNAVFRYNRCRKIYSTLSDIPTDVVQRFNKYGCNKKQVIVIGTILAAVVACRRIYKAYHTLNVKPQGGAMCVPIQDEEQVENQWLVPELTGRDVDHKLETMTHDQVDAFVKKHLGRAVFDDQYTSNIWPVCKNIWLVNWHMLTQNYRKVAIARSREGTLNSNVVCKISECCYQRIGETDFGLIYLPAGGSQKDTRRLFPETVTGRNTAGKMYTKLEDGTVATDQFNCSYYLYTIQNERWKFECTSDAVCYSASKPTTCGMCMSPIINLGRQPCFVGFHSAGQPDSNIGVAQQITRSQIDNGIAALLAKPYVCEIHSAGIRELDVDGVTMLGRINPKSTLNFQGGGSGIFFGDHSVGCSNPRSRVTETLLCKDYEEALGIENQYGPPKNMGSWKPKHAEMQKILNTTEVEPEYMEMAYIDFKTKIDAGLARKTGWEKRVHKIDNVTNVSGADGVRFIDAINKNSSTGWPLNRPKSEIIVDYVEDDCESVTCPKTLSPEWWARVDACEAKLRTGERVYFVNRASLKDEPKKKDSEKVRIFYGTPVEALMLMRRYFLTTCKLIMENPELFETTVGINTCSKEWNDFVVQVTKFRDAILAGDFVSFDSEAGANALLLTFELMIHINMSSGNYDEEDRMVMNGLRTEISQPLLEFFGEALMTFGNHVSGQSTTIIVNSLLNCLYERAGYYKIFAGKPPGLFHKYVRLRTNGDDNIMSVAPGARKFNMMTLSAVYKTWGLKYTLPDKSEITEPYMKFEDVTYLKRRMVYDEELKVYKAPLEEDSIHKMMMVHIPSKILSRHEQAAECINGALREWYFHGKEKFAAMHKVLSDLADKHVLRCHMQGDSLLSWEECEKYFTDRL